MKVLKIKNTVSGGFWPLGEEEGSLLSSSLRLDKARERMNELEYASIRMI